MAVVGEAALLVLAWGIGRWLGISAFAQLGVGVLGFVWGAVAAVPLVLGLGWIATTRREAIRRLVDLVTEQLGPVFVECSRLQLAVFTLLVGISEEALFRGIVQTGLGRLGSEVGALIGSSVLFGLAHFLTPMYALLAGLAGLYLGALLLFGGNLSIPILAHAIYDFVALQYLTHRYRASHAALLSA